jgi:hypothetical protein
MYIAPLLHALHLAHLVSGQSDIHIDILKYITNLIINSKCEA